MAVQTEYEVVAPSGRTVLTTDRRDIAIAHVARHADAVPGLHVEEVVTTITRRAVRLTPLRLVRG